MSKNKPDVVDVIAALEAGRPALEAADEDQAEDQAEQDEAQPDDEAHAEEEAAPAPGEAAPSSAPAAQQIEPSLTLWRTRPSAELFDGLKAADLVAFLLPMTPVTYKNFAGDQVALDPSPVEAGTAADYLKVGAALRGRVGDDISSSWVLAAALCGAPAAPLILIGRLVDAAMPVAWIKESEPDAAMLQVAASWLQWSHCLRSPALLANQVLDALPDDEFCSAAKNVAFQARRRKIHPEEWAGVPSPPDKAKPAAHPAAASRAALLGGVETEYGQPVLTVAPHGIGDADVGQGREIAKRFPLLAEPLPLAVAPPVDALAGALEEEFPWMSEAIAALRDDLVMRSRAGLLSFRLRPTLLVGPPGCGKTRFARRLAGLVGTGVGEVAAAGSSDNRLLAGTARGWGSAAPSLPVQVIHRSGRANPVIVVDEIEKAGGSGRNGDIRSTLLGLLEPETARSFPDECLMAPVDLSQVTWLLTANEIGPIPRPLLSRMRVVQVEPPSPAHWPAILSSLRRDLANELGIDVEDLPALAPGAEAALRAAFEAGASVRRVKAALERALAAGGPAAGPQMH